jgi:signal transduction histidine kinase
VSASLKRTIQRQLLGPALSVVAISLAASSLLTAYLLATAARARQDQHLHRVVSTLTASGFPLTSPVLAKMSGLSGADFIGLNTRGEVTEATMQLGPDDLASLAQLPIRATLDQFTPPDELWILGRRYLVNRIGIPPSPQALGTRSLVVLSSDDDWWAANRGVILAPLFVGGGATCVLVVLITLLARRFVRPIRRLRQQALAIAGGDFREAPVEAWSEEFVDLSRVINEMAQKLATYEEHVRRSERLRTLGQLSGGIAHQLRNAATGARMALGLHERECPIAEGCETLEVAGRQLSLIETHLQRLLTLGRDHAVQWREFDLVNLVERVVPLVRPACVHAGIALNWTRPDRSCAVVGDYDSLEQLLLNLLLNAIEAAASQAGGEKTIVLEIEESDGILLRVKDSGVGPAPQLHSSLFEPFVTDKPDGTGLGLAVAQKAAREHGGSIAWRRDGGMTCFEVRLPLQVVEKHHGSVAHCR